MCVAVIADLHQRRTHHLLDCNTRTRTVLASHHHALAAEQGLARHTRVIIGRKVRIKHGIGNLIGHLVGMSFRNRFGGEKSKSHVCSASSRFKARDITRIRAMNGNIKLVAGNSHPAFAREISGYLGVPLARTLFKRFGNENIMFQCLENVREQDVFVIQTSTPPLSDHILELLI